MEIKGKLLVSQIIRDLPAGSKGWVVPSQFLYLHKSGDQYLLYTNLESTYVSEKESDFSLLVSKVDETAEGYMFDLSEISFGTVSNVSPPKDLTPYSGPYPIPDGIEQYTLVGSYSRLSFGEINLFLEEAQISVQNEDGIYSSNELEAILEALLLKSQNDWINKNPIELAEQVISIRKVVEEVEASKNVKQIEEDGTIIVRVAAWKYVKKSLSKRIKSLKSIVKSKLINAERNILSEYFYKFEEDEELYSLIPTK